MCGWSSGTHTRRSSTHSGKYQVSYWYSYFSWWWAHSCPKRVQNRNKHKKKELCTRLFLFTGPLECINYILWRWPFKCWKKLVLSILLLKWWFHNMWVYVLVFIWYSNTSARIWSRYHVLYLSVATPYHVLYLSVATPYHVLYLSGATPYHVLYLSVATPYHVLYLSVATPYHVLYLSVATPYHVLYLSGATPYHVVYLSGATPYHVLYLSGATPYHVLYLSGATPYKYLPYLLTFLG
jgi:hypothetical protein